MATGHGPLAQRQSGGLLTRASRVRPPDGLRNIARRVGVAVISPGPQPGEREFKSRTRHDITAPSSMGKIAVFQAAEQGSTPCGATKAAVRQDRYEDGKARHSRSGVVQSVGRCSVKAAIWVRIPVPEPWWRSSVRSRALARQARGHGFESRRHRFTITLLW